MHENGQFKEHLVLLPREQWEVLLYDHHPGYLSWSQYEDNLKQLANNRTNTELSGPPREGQALLQGLLLCGRCGQRMTVRYTGNGGISPQYECHRRWENGQKATCSHLRCEVLDQVITARIMDMLKPANLEIALLALDKVLCQEDEVETSWKLALERAQYEAERAQRQYDLAEPENRLVTRSLETRWNEKLVALNSLREEYEKHRSSRLWRPSPKQREDILAMAEDLPRIWQAPGTSFKDRKRIIRLLIEDITVNCKPRCKDVTMGIRWRSNCHEVIYTTKPLPPSISRKHSPEMVNLVEELATVMTDDKIAEHLNESGHRSSTGKLFTKDSINWIRYRYHIPGPKGGDGYTVKETAEHFGVSTHVIYYWLNRGLLQGSKLAPGWPWKITFDDETEKILCEWAKRSCRIAKAKKEV